MEKLSFASKGSEPPGWLLEAAPTLWPSVMDVIGDARSLGCRTDDEGTRTYWLEPLVGIPPFRSQGEGEQNFVAGIMTLALAHAERVKREDARRARDEIEAQLRSAEAEQRRLRG